ncbi:MAG: DUF805 domain-containing protein [Bacteroidetes bacterium]|nr:DUF805 domain-containing protein [Bacteroidota bacterium]
MDEFLFYFTKCLKNYANFTGRARRKEFWMFVAVNVAISFILGFIGGIISDILGNIVSGIYAVALVVPSIAVAVRRLHDIGKSGWFYFLLLVPIIGAIILIVWACKPGDEGENEYGQDPKETSEV